MRKRTWEFVLTSFGLLQLSTERTHKNKTADMGQQVLRKNPEVTFIARSKKILIGVRMVWSSVREALGRIEEAVLTNVSGTHRGDRKA